MIVLMLLYKQIIFEILTGLDDVVHAGLLLQTDSVLSSAQ